MLSGFVLAMLLAIVTLLRYPGNTQTATRYIALVAGAIVIELSMCLWVVFWGSRPRSVEQAAIVQRGALVGLFCGICWVIEISFNNFVPPDISTGTARFYIDNGFWILIAIVIFITAVVTSHQFRRAIFGIQVAVWSGLVSGLMACIMGSSLGAIWIGFLLRDPLLIAEFAQRGSASGAPTMSAYVAYDTLTGALGHLVVLGPIMGLLLGTFGGLLGKAFRWRCAK